MRVLAIGCDMDEIRNGALGALGASVGVTTDRPLTIALLGAGRQAFAQAEHLADTFDIVELRVWCRRPERYRRFAARLEARSAVPTRYAPEPEAALDGAHVVVTATLSPHPAPSRAS